jgi:hypothetical protein
MSVTGIGSSCASMAVSAARAVASSRTDNMARINAE